MSYWWESAYRDGRRFAGRSWASVRDVNFNAVEKHLAGLQDSFKTWAWSRVVRHCATLLEQIAWIYVSHKVKTPEELGAISQTMELWRRQINRRGKKPAVQSLRVYPVLVFSAASYKTGKSESRLVRLISAYWLRTEA